jgi:acyl dehydratase
MKMKIIRYLIFLPVLLLLSCVNKDVPETFQGELFGVKTEFKIVYPGVYDENEQRVYDEMREVLSGGEKELAEKIQAQANGKKFYVGKEVVSHQLDFNHGWIPTKDYTPGIDDFVANAKQLALENPLYIDPEYAANSRYGALTAAPFAVDIAVGFPYQPKLSEAYVWGAGRLEGGLKSSAKIGAGHEVTFYKPIYAGDTLNSVVTRHEMIDVTPEGGSQARFFRVIGAGDMYNQRGEKVMSISHKGTEAYLIFNDPSVAEQFEDKVPHPSGVRSMKQDWSKIRARHLYTDADWDYIKGIWSKEYIRGADTLYWEDVDIGDEPAWTCDGPFLRQGRSNEYMAVRDILMNRPEEVQGKLYKDSWGVYRMKEGSPDDYMFEAPPSTTAMILSPELMANLPEMVTDPNARIGVQNLIPRKYGVKVVTNWMGDDGWLHKLAWFVGGPAEGVELPPEDYGRPSSLYRVPFLKEQGKTVSTYGFDGDLAIAKAYVCDKYIKDGHHYVDLVVWLEIIDGSIWSECYAVVELPSREDKKI